MSTYNYSRYKILIDPKSKKTQGLRIGDVVRRQYFDYPNLIYSLMIVTETGVDIIGGEESSYFIGALIEGDEPQSGELLDFVRVTNLFDADRGGALYLTASDSEAPFMDVIDGLAIENSLCYPFMDGENSELPDMNKYAASGTKYLQSTYTRSTQEASRIFRITRNEVSLAANDLLGFKQSIERKLEHPQRVVISYKIRASRKMEIVPIQFGYTTAEEIDGSDTIHINTEWEYKLHLITIDYPSKYQRSFFINLTNFLLSTDEWCEIADLNIVLQSDISTFANAAKVRIGKVKGIVDPVFGVLDGYGAYFQNMYATCNVNIAGTLTAGDENGFSSTFYVGKIHKNAIRNSIACEFQDQTTKVTNGNTPVGIGNVWITGTRTKLVVQSDEWRKSRTGQKYCFSIWAKSETAIQLSTYQDEHHIQNIEIDSADWKRYSVPFVIRDSKDINCVLGLNTPIEGLLITAPQLEAGSTPTQYQPTDGTLSYVEDYGAWFSKGGIGGTIQNPLLRLNEDGSISSRDYSFVINPDGTGHFASGRFKWSKDTITLQDVTIRWEDFDEEAKENMQAKYVTLEGTDIIHYADVLEQGKCEPEKVNIFAREVNFTATKRKWYYMDSNSQWKDLYYDNRDFIAISPDGHYWEERNVLSIQYVAACNNMEFSDIFTIHKQYDGQSSYSVYINSDNGLVFRNGIIQTTLTASLYKGGEDITGLIPEKNFRWKKVSNDPQSDMIWNSRDISGKELTLTGEDVYRKAVFDCEVTISTM